MRPTMQLLALLPPLLTACGDANPPAHSTLTEDSIAGMVLTDAGPVTRAKIEARDSRGQLVASTELSGASHYRLLIPAGSSYPLVLTALPEGATEPLKAAVTSELAEEQDISEVTSIVVETALSLGGLTESNLAKAAGAAISQRKTSGGSGSSSGFKGDPTKNYGGWH